MSTTPLAEATSLAESIIDALAMSRWTEVTSRFDAQMNSGLTSDGLAAAWAQVIGMAGAYEGHGVPEATRAADITITNTPLAFEAGDFIARISFHDDHSIAGLYILPSEPTA